MATVISDPQLILMDAVLSMDVYNEDVATAPATVKEALEHRGIVGGADVVLSYFDDSTLFGAVGYDCNYGDMILAQVSISRYAIFPETSLVHLTYSG